MSNILDSYKGRKKWLVIIPVLALLAAFLLSRLIPEWEVLLRAPNGPISPIPSTIEFNTILSKAHAGDAESQLFMGVFYANGDYVQQSYSEAAEWYIKAAQQGNARAQRNLALLYECGVGVERDYVSAFKWYMKAVKQGDGAAMLGISGFVFTCRRSLVPENWGTADYWRLNGYHQMWVNHAKYNNIKLDGTIEQFEETLREYISKHACIHDLEDYESKVQRGLSPYTIRYNYTIPKGYTYYNLYNTGQRFFQVDEYVVKEVWFRAIAGDNESQLRMAVFQFQGVRARETIEIESRKLTRWLRHSANRGNPRAKFLMAFPVTRYPQQGYQRIAIINNLDDNITQLRMLQQAAESDEEEFFEDEYIKALLTFQDKARNELRYHNFPSFEEQIRAAGKRRRTSSPREETVKGNAQVILYLIEELLKNKSDNTMQIRLLAQRFFSLPNVNQMIRSIPVSNHWSPKKRLESLLQIGEQERFLLLGIQAYKMKEYVEAVNHFKKVDRYPISLYLRGVILSKYKIIIDDCSEIEIPEIMKIIGLDYDDLGEMDYSSKCGLIFLLHAAERGLSISLYDAASILNEFNRDCGSQSGVWELSKRGKFLESRISSVATRLRDMFLDTNEWYLLSSELDFMASYYTTSLIPYHFLFYND